MSPSFQLRLAWEWAPFRQRTEAEKRRPFNLLEVVFGVQICRLSQFKLAQMPRELDVLLENELTREEQNKQTPVDGWRRKPSQT